MSTRINLNVPNIARAAPAATFSRPQQGATFTRTPAPAVAQNTTSLVGVPHLAPSLGLQPPVSSNPVVQAALKNYGGTPRFQKSADGSAPTSSAQPAAYTPTNVPANVGPVAVTTPTAPVLTYGGSSGGATPANYAANRNIDANAIYQRAFQDIIGPAFYAKVLGGDLNPIFTSDRTDLVSGKVYPGLTDFAWNDKADALAHALAFDRTTAINNANAQANKAGIAAANAAREGATGTQNTASGAASPSSSGSSALVWLALGAKLLGFF